ncbi:MAG: signal peptidase II [Bacilli bacterium]|nr:signal peptidase II [Bacilli bacterium]
MLKLIIIIILLTGLDQMIKVLISSLFALGTSKEIINNFFYLTYVQNDGAAWSLFSNQTLMLILIAVIALVIIYNQFIKNKQLNKIDIILLSMLIAGILGNLIDRIIYGYVIDYLDFRIFNYNFPVFNLADTLIVLATIALLIKTYKEEKHGKIQST